MQPRHVTRLIVLLSAALALPACARGPAGPEPVTAPPAAAADTPAATEGATSATRGRAQSPTCGCCGLWVEHMQEAGFQVEVRDTHALHSVKQELGIPTGKASCHTAEVDGYVVEGHVPAADIKRLPAERPDARGLLLPGMPLGSPGMETPDGRVQPYTVELLADDGTTSVFQEH